MPQIDSGIPSFQRIALFSDIHGNLPALQAVYQHAQSYGAQIFLNAGDIVGYGPFPNECIQFIRSKKMVNVIGDYDQKVLCFPQKKEKYAKKKHPLKVHAFQWTYDQLSQENLEFLLALPVSEKISFADKTIFLTHGAPLDIKAHLGFRTTQQEWKLNQEKAQSDFIITGNSHVFWKKKVGDSIFINPGSVGRQDDGDPRASYAMLSLGNSIQINHFRVAYDISTLLSAFEVYNLPVEFSYMFRNGINLDNTLEELAQAEK